MASLAIKSYLSENLNNVGGLFSRHMLGAVMSADGQFSNKERMNWESKVVRFP